MSCENRAIPLFVIGFLAMFLAPLVVEMTR
jgi:hypothetical protein